MESYLPLIMAAVVGLAVILLARSRGKSPTGSGAGAPREPNGREQEK
jgi:hypothetical protein